MESGQRRALRADEESGSVPHVTRKRDVESWLDGIIKSVVQRVSDDANDLHPFVWMGSANDILGIFRTDFQCWYPNLPSYYSTCGEITPHKALIHNYNCGTACDSALVPKRPCRAAGCAKLKNSWR